MKKQCHQIIAMSRKTTFAFISSLNKKAAIVLHYKSFRISRNMWHSFLLSTLLLKIVAFFKFLLNYTILKKVDFPRYFSTCFEIVAENCNYCISFEGQYFEKLLVIIYVPKLLYYLLFNA